MHRGDDRFDEFVRARWSSTARLAYALTLDRGRAEDLTQDALAKLWFRWSRVRDGNPDAYLRRILLTTYLSGRRRRWVGERPTAAPPESLVAAGTERVDDRDELRQALARLSPRQRAVVFLRYAEDLSEREVADVLGCSQGAVKQHASRGLAALRRVIPAVPEDQLTDATRGHDHA